MKLKYPFELCNFGSKVYFILKLLSKVNFFAYQKWIFSHIICLTLAYTVICFYRNKLSAQWNLMPILITFTVCVLLSQWTSLRRYEKFKKRVEVWCRSRSSLIFSRFIIFTFRNYFTICKIVLCIWRRIIFFCDHNFMKKVILSCLKMNLEISHKLR